MPSKTTSSVCAVPWCQLVGSLPCRPNNSGWPVCALFRVAAIEAVTVDLHQMRQTGSPFKGALRPTRRPPVGEVLFPVQPLIASRLCQWMGPKAKFR